MCQVMILALDQGCANPHPDSSQLKKIQYCILYIKKLEVKKSLVFCRAQISKNRKFGQTRLCDASEPYNFLKNQGNPTFLSAQILRIWPKTAQNFFVNSYFAQKFVAVSGSFDPLYKVEDFFYLYKTFQTTETIRKPDMLVLFSNGDVVKMTIQKSGTKHLQWGSEYQTSLVFKWLKRGWMPNGLFFKYPTAQLYAPCT